MATYTVAFTGASGAPYGHRLLQLLVEQGHSIYFTASGEALSILNNEVRLLLKGSETDIQYTLQNHFKAREGQISYFSETDLYAPVASGSVKIDAMIVIPCSMKALAAIANGFASNLIERAADVTLKEKRKLILVPRETPLSAIHLRNMLALAEMGCHIIPAMPAFYNHPQTIEDMVNFIAGRVLDSLGIEHSVSPRWGGKG